MLRNYETIKRYSLQRREIHPETRGTFCVTTKTGEQLHVWVSRAQFSKKKQKRALNIKSIAIMLKSEGEDLKSIYLKKKLTAAAALIHRFILFSCFCLLLENVPKPATTFHQIAHLIFVGLYLSQ